MSLNDIRGVPVSSNNREALDGLETSFSLFQGYFNDPLASIDEVLAADPDFVMGHCFRAGLFLVSSEKAAVTELRKSVQTAKACSAGANNREKGHIAAASAWLDGDFHRAAALYGEILVDYPRDGIALQFGHLCDFLLGQSSMLRDRVARVLPEWDDDVPGYGYLLGMLAFGFEEMGDYQRAEEVGRRAVELIPTDTWGIHAVAHVFEMQGRIDEGKEWFRSRIPDWATDNGFAFHNWWHLALYHLDQEEFGEVLRIYDEHIRPAPSEVAMELVDAVALLWRLHLAGAEVGDRWKEIADTYGPVAEDGYYAFNDMHAIMSFVATERWGEVKRVLDTVADRARSNDSNGLMTRDVGLPACEGMAAFGRRDYATVIDRLMPLRPIAHRFGGSHAQRDVLSQTLIESALRSGRYRLAKALANERTVWKPSGPLGWRYQERAERGLVGSGAGQAA